MPESGLNAALGRLPESLERRVERDRLPGLVAGVVVDQELVWSQGFGRADLDLPRPGDAQTLHRVASITKTLTTAAILQLRDAGKLGLDDPLAEHLPEFSEARARAGSVAGVTLRRMLCHHAGLTTESPLPSWDALEFPTREALVAALPRLEVVIPQDSAFKYSNLAFGLLGEVVRRVSGRPYEEYMRTEILDPLGMTSSVFELTPELQPRFATGYTLDPYADRPQPAPYFPLRGLAACGQLHSSVQDLARWISLQFRTAAGARGGAQVLRGATLEESHRPQYLEPDWSVGYCLGWRAVRSGNRVYHGHGGGIYGFASQILFSKTSRVGVICLANAWPHPGVLETAVEMLDELLDAQAAEPAAAPGPGSAAASPEIRRLLGLYIAGAGVPGQIAYRGGVLRLEKSLLSEYALHAPADLEATEDPAAFIVRGGRASGERLEFRLDALGNALDFTLGGFVYRRVDFGRPVS